MSGLDARMYRDYAHCNLVSVILLKQSGGPERGIAFVPVL
jgi:hypothetical protein